MNRLIKFIVKFINPTKETLNVEAEFTINVIGAAINQILSTTDSDDAVVILTNKLYKVLRKHQVSKNFISKNEALFIFDKICYNQKQANIVFGYSSIFTNLKPGKFLIFPVAKTTELIN